MEGIILFFASFSAKNNNPIIAAITILISLILDT